MKVFKEARGDEGKYLHYQNCTAKQLIFLLYVGQVVTTLPDNKVKEILYHKMPDLWRKKMTKQGYNYVHNTIQQRLGFLET